MKNMQSSVGNFAEFIIRWRSGGSLGFLGAVAAGGASTGAHTVSPLLSEMWISVSLGEAKGGLAPQEPLRYSASVRRSPVSTNTVPPKPKAAKRAFF